MVDTHTHMYKEYYDDIEKYISDANDNGINKFIASGTDRETSKEVIGLSKKYDNVFVTVGVHPGENDTCEWIESMVEDHKVVGIGEIGLDYHYEYDKEEQKSKFRTCLDIATKYNLPIVVHSRDANDDVIDILKEYNLNGVIHSFSGSIEEAKKFISMGYKIGINGIVTFKNGEDLREVVRNINIDDIVLETDAPFLSPDPYRGRQNSSRNILYIAKKIAEIKDLSLEEVDNITTNNVYQIFDKMNV